MYTEKQKNKKTKKPKKKTKKPKKNKKKKKNEMNKGTCTTKKKKKNRIEKFKTQNLRRDIAALELVEDTKVTNKEKGKM